MCSYYLQISEGTKNSRSKNTTPMFKCLKSLWSAKILTIVISQQLLIHGFRLCYSEERKSTLECIKICHSSYDLIYISLRNDLLCKWHYWKWATHTFQFPKVTKYVVDRVQNLTWFFSWIKHQSTLFLIQLSV